MTKKGIKANFITKLIFTGGSAIFIASKEVIKGHPLKAVNFKENSKAVKPSIS